MLDWPTGLWTGILMHLTGSLDWDTLSLDEKGVRVQQILVSGNTEAYGTSQPKQIKHKNRKLKRLQQEQRQVAQVER